MGRNRIKEIRKKLGMTQSQLAETVGSSQQQIQRMETGIQNANFDIALKICSALGTPIETVFPEAKRPLTRLRQKKTERSDAFSRVDEKTQTDLRDAGIEIYPNDCYFECHLRGGAIVTLQVPSQEADRLVYVLQIADGRGIPFVLFDCEEGWRVLLNLDNLVYSRFIPRASTTTQEIDVDTAWVYLTNSEEPLEFDIATGGEELENLLYCADVSVEPNEHLFFTDENLVRIFFRAADTAMIQIPIENLEPDMLDDDEADD